MSIKFGKTIKIFFIYGDPNGRMSCELSNWTGKAYKIPRIKIKECVDRNDMDSTGVYFLFGRNEENKDQVYIGEAENILKRLTQHLVEKDFWNETIVFISKDENLNKAHVKYLENRLHESAKLINRYSVTNASIPTKSSLSESERAEMEEFIEHVKLLINTLGHKIFEEKREVKSTPKQQHGVFYLNAARGANAQGEPTSEGFVVLKGSKIAISPVPSFPMPSQKLRQSLIDKGIIIESDEGLELTEDTIFGSPSTAAAIVMGRAANGLTDWRLSDGRNLKSFESEKGIDNSVILHSK